MKKSMVTDLKEGMIVDSTFLIKDKTLGTGKTGKDYLTIVLGDKSGDVEARVWDNAKEIDSTISTNDVIQVRGRVNNYKGKLQVSVDEIRWIDKSLVELSDYVMRSLRSSDEMFYELKMLMATMDNPYLKSLTELFFSKEDMINLFKASSAAKSIHHAYAGGLLEHTLNVVKLVDMIVSIYEGIDRSLLLTAAMFHDIGKIKELGGEFATEYTDEGRLIGHIVIGTVIVDKLISEIKDFPLELAMLLKHSILSHHGEYEFGSPKRPKLMEAIILHYAEDMDAKIASMRAHIKNETNNDGNWTSFDNPLGRYIYKRHYIETMGKDEDRGK